MTDYKKLIEDIWRAGGEAYLVGGWVRDKILGRRSQDVDIEVIGIPRKKFEKILDGYGRYYRCGKAYEIYILGHSIEISYVEESVSVRECARRRDFTINALYYNPLKDEYHDFFRGREDIEEGVIRAVDRKTILTDPIRIIRAAELASRLGFIVDKELMTYFREMKGCIGEAARERVEEEFQKIYLLSEKPSRAMDILDRSGVLEEILPRLDRLKGIVQDEVYHPEGDVYTHILMMLDVLPRERRSPEVFWGIIYHDMGKEETWPDFRDHAQRSYEIFLEEGAELIQSKRIRSTVASMVLYHEEPLQMMLKGIERIDVKKLAVRVDLMKLLDLYTCDVVGRGRVDNSQELEAVERIGEIYHEIRGELDPVVRGRDLMEWGIEDRRSYSEILGRLYELQLEEKFQDIQGAKALYFRNLKA